MIPVLDMPLSAIDPKEIRHILGMVTPMDAVDQEHLDQACDYAVTFLPEIVAEAGRIEIYPDSKAARASEMARVILKRLLAKRTQWLRENGGYRQMQSMG